jgi:S-adenosylhomocysteine hydrolase
LVLVEWESEGGTVMPPETIVGIFNNVFMFEKAMKVLTTLEGIQIFKPDDHTMEIKFKVDSKELRRKVVEAIRTNKGYIEEDTTRIKQIEKVAKSGALDLPVFG